MYNTGQTAVFLKDLTGREYPAIAEVNRTKRVNGQRETSLSFLYTEINEDFMSDLEFGWQVLFKGEWYTITHPGYSTDGDYFSINVTAVLSFFVDMNGYYLQDKAEDKSLTPAAYFGNLFQGTPYNYVMVDGLSANTLTYSENQSKTERFLYGIDRFNAEYMVRGKLVYIYSLVGSDKDVILHEDLNIKDVSIEVDASGFHTYAKGFGDKDENDTDAEYKLETDYVSPLAAKYGMIEGPAIYDGRYKDKPALKEAIKNQVENSYTASTEIQAVDLTNNGYPEMQFEEGDRIWLGVDRLKLNQKVRVMEINESFDWEGNIITASYTVGNEGIATRYKTQQYNTLRDFRDIMTGKKRIEYNWLPDAIQRASEIINGNQDSRFRYGAGEIIGINESNPNGYMRFNTDGIGFSRDGGKTYRSAMTYEGIVADAITVGTLRGINIEGVNIIAGTIAGFNPTIYFGSPTNGSKINYFDNGMRFMRDDYSYYRVNQGGSTGSVKVGDKFLHQFYGAGRPIFNFGVSTDGNTMITSNTGMIKFSETNQEIQFRNNFDSDYQNIRTRNINAANIETLAVFSKYNPGRRMLNDFNNGNVAVNAVGDTLYLGYEQTKKVLAGAPIDMQSHSLRAGAADIVTDGIDHIIRANMSQSIIYLQANNRIRATAPQSSTSFIPIEASEFNTVSNRDYKKNIEDYTKNATEQIKSTPVRYYHMNEDDNEIDPKRIGLIVQESPMDIVTIDGGDSINIYAMASMLWKAAQELTQRLEELENGTTTE